jgi:hypothetical protein
MVGDGVDAAFQSLGRAGGDFVAHGVGEGFGGPVGVDGVAEDMNRAVEFYEGLGALVAEDVSAELA